MTSKYIKVYPVGEWPFGTVIRPTDRVREFFPPDCRHMIIGPQPSNPTTAIVAIDLTSDRSTFYVHLREGLHRRWDIVPETGL